MVPSLSFEFFASVLRHHTLPFLSIVLVTIGGQAIGMREMSIYELNSDYVLYSKTGIRDSKIARYVFRNAMLPQITGLALSIGTMVGGSLICEIVFSYPGIGTWMFTAIRQLDYPLISGCTLLIALAVLLANFTIDLIYGWIQESRPLRWRINNMNSSFRILIKSPKFMFGACMLLAMIGMVLIYPLFNRNDPLEMIALAYQPPDSKLLLGSDNFGGDLFLN